MDERVLLPGITEWFRIGDKERVVRTAEILKELRIKEFRILFSWADWETNEGPAWFDYHIPLLAQCGARLIPALFYTPLEKARPTTDGARRTSHPPQNLHDYSVFVQTMIERYGIYFDWLQIWNEPNWKPYWEWDLDPDARLFSEMATEAAHTIHRYGKKAALGGLSPFEPEWISLIDTHGLLTHLDAIGIHYSPSWDDQRRRWYGFSNEIKTARAHLQGLGKNIEVWIAETGYATLNNSKESYKKQIAFFEEARHAPADKILWFSVFDQRHDHKTDNEITMQGRKEKAAYHFGIVHEDGTPKPLFRHWRNIVGNKKNT